MKSLKQHSKVATCFIALIAVGIFITVCPAWPADLKIKQKTFASPEQAVQALVDAMKTRNTKMIAGVFGPQYVSLLASGDQIRDNSDRELFIKAYEEKSSMERKGKDKIILHVGESDWPFPVPLIQKKSGWLFDSKEGKEELLNRRIGRNELRVIETMRAYVAAQREYASKDQMGDGIQAAQRIMSTPGQKDGLFWEAKEGEAESPFGPLVAAAAREGYKRETTTGSAPFQGYYFRVLTAQGDKAPGGAYDYVVKGNMTLGFGLIAYPAKYGSSGIMTFVVNQGGVVYQKDLGKKTAQVASAIKVYNPDDSWDQTEPAVAK